MCPNGSRHSSLNGRSSSTPSTKLRKSLINISHRNFQSPIRSIIFIVRRASTPNDNERTIDGFSIDTNRRGRILPESPAKSILYVCLANALRLDDHPASTISRKRKLSVESAHICRMLSPVSIHVRCVCARVRLQTLCLF